MAELGLDPGVPWSVRSLDPDIYHPSDTDLVLLYYDYLLTLAHEIEYIWFSQRFWSLPSVIFFLNRYIGLLTHAAFAVSTIRYVNVKSHLLTSPR